MNATAAGRRILVAVVAIAVIGAGNLTAQGSPPREERPDVESWRVAGEVFAGAYAGYAGYFVGRLIGTRVADMVVAKGNGEPTRRALRNTFGYASGAFATSGAVWGVGSLQGQTGDYETTLLGTGVGFGVAVLVNHTLLLPAHGDQSGSARFMRRTAEFIEVLLPSIGATIAFNSTRRFDR